MAIVEKLPTIEDVNPANPGMALQQANLSSLSAILGTDRSSLSNLSGIAPINRSTPSTSSPSNNILQEIVDAMYQGDTNKAIQLLTKILKNPSTSSQLPQPSGPQMPSGGGMPQIPSAGSEMNPGSGMMPGMQPFGMQQIPWNLFNPPVGGNPWVQQGGNIQPANRALAPNAAPAQAPAPVQAPQAQMVEVNPSGYLVDKVTGEPVTDANGHPLQLATSKDLDPNATKVNVDQNNNIVDAKGDPIKTAATPNGLQMAEKGQDAVPAQAPVPVQDPQAAPAPAAAPVAVVDSPAMSNDGNTYKPGDVIGADGQFKIDPDGTVLYNKDNPENGGKAGQPVSADPSSGSQIQLIPGTDQFQIKGGPADGQNLNLEDNGHFYRPGEKSNDPENYVDQPQPKFDGPANDSPPSDTTTASMDTPSPEDSSSGTDTATADPGVGMESMAMAGGGGDAGGDAGMMS